MIIVAYRVTKIWFCFQMALVEDAGAGASAEDPEALLNEWLGELTVLTAVSIIYPWYN